eukprot:403367997
MQQLNKQVNEVEQSQQALQKQQPATQKKQQPKYEEEDVVKKNFKRFLKLQKFERQSEIELRYGEEYDQNDFIQRDGIFELYRVPGPHINLVRRYCYMLDQDYNHNKVMVSGYLQGIMRHLELQITNDGAFQNLNKDQNQNWQISLAKQKQEFSHQPQRPLSNKMQQKYDSPSKNSLHSQKTSRQNQNSASTNSKTACIQQ